MTDKKKFEIPEAVGLTENISFEPTLECKKWSNERVKKAALVGLLVVPVMMLLVGTVSAGVMYKQYKHASSSQKAVYRKLVGYIERSVSEIYSFHVHQFELEQSRTRKR